MKSSSVLLITSAQNDLLAPTGKAWPMVKESVLQNDVPNKPGADFIVEASPQHGDIVLKARQGFSSFWANTIQQTLNELGASTLYLAGMLAEGCVSSHARDAVEKRLPPRGHLGRHRLDQ